MKQFDLANKLFILILALPFVVLFTGITPADYHLLKQIELSTYFSNSLIIICLALIMANIIGVILAWLSSFYYFKHKRLFEIMAILPLAIPAYILAIIYGYISEIEIAYICQQISGAYCHISLRNLFGAALIFALGFFPYIFLFCKSYFYKVKTQLMIGSVYNLTHRKIFKHIALPALLPAIISSNLLIAMEIVADFGVVSFFGIETFATEIYRFWFFKNNIEIALLLSVILLVFILILSALGYLSKTKRSYEIDQVNLNNEHFAELSGKKLFYLWLGAGLVFFFSFLLPVLTMLGWSITHLDIFIAKKTLSSLANSVILALLGGLFICFCSFFNVSYNKLNRRNPSILSQIISLGYAIPGSVIAIAVIYTLFNIFELLNLDIQLTGIAAIIALIYAYQIRFTAICYNKFNSGWEQISDEVQIVSKTFLRNNFLRTFKIILPTLQKTFLVSLLIIMIEISKELPATLILRPFNFDTVATRTYMLASDESVKEAGATALLIVLANLLPILFLQKYLYQKTNVKT